MLKKLSVVFIMVLICAAMLSAESVDWNSNYKEGNVALSLDAGYEWGNPAEICAYPAAELIILKPDLGDVSFIDFGGKLMARVGIGFPAFDIGAGLAGTVHFGFKDLLEDELGGYFDPIDIFAEVGICFDFMRIANSPLGLVVNSGINYWLEDDFAIGFKYSSWNSYDGATLSVHYKFKNQKKAEKAIDKKMNA